MSKIKRLYGKSKSPSEMSNKFIPADGQSAFLCRNSPLNRSPVGNLDMSSGVFVDPKLSNSGSQHGFNMSNLGGQRSRHHNSVKYTSSVNLSSRIKAKTTKNSKSKKKNHSYHKIPEFKSNKHSHQRLPHYEIVNKPTIEYQSCK